MEQTTNYNEPNCVTKTWWTIKYAVRSWIEWQDAKAWAKKMHPAWLYLAIKGSKEETRDKYRRKILNEYRMI